MNIKDLSKIESFLFQNRLQEALAEIERLEKLSIRDDETLILFLKKVQILSQLGDCFKLCKIIREILEKHFLSSIKGNISNLVDEKLLNSLNDFYCDCLIATKQFEEFSRWLEFLSQKQPEIFSQGLKQYSEILKQNQIQVSHQQEKSEIICEFQEDSVQIIFSLKFANANSKMENFILKHDLDLNSLSLFNSNQSKIVEIFLPEKAVLSFQKYENKNFSICGILRKEEQNKIWKNLSKNVKAMENLKISFLNITHYENDEPNKSQRQEKNWDKIVKEEEEKDLKEKNYDCDPALHFFRQIYENADEDAKRAMLKSFATSGGKVLSTNWQEVKDRDYSKEEKSS